MQLCEQVFPPPQKIERLDTYCDLSKGVAWTETTTDLDTVSRTLLEQTLARVSTAEGSSLEKPTILVNHDVKIVGQGYRLAINPTQITLDASSACGFFWAVQTLLQWIGQETNGLIRCGTIHDWPDIPNRGIMLDISRNKVPKMETLFRLVDCFASLKFNQLQLYVEHTFAYTQHTAIWTNASPFTADEVRHLVAYCADRFIDCVPNQNSFGHFHRWLRFPSYRHLAECPEGVEHPFSREKEPFSLCATDPKVIDFLRELYAEYLPLFSSPWVNTGLDETFDLGLGRSAEACTQMGKQRVYLSFLRQVHALVAAHGKRMMCWADILLEHPELLTDLPSNLVALLWGYEADHPFEEQCQLLRSSDLDFYVCPGTSSWNSFGGRWDTCRANITQAAQAGQRHGAQGYLLTDWGDRGHLQPLCISYPAFVLAGCVAWNSKNIPTDTVITQAVNHFFFETEALGEAIIRTGQLHQASEAFPLNGTALFYLWWFIDKDLTFQRVAGLTSQGLSRVTNQAATLLDDLTSMSLASTEAKQTQAELSWVCKQLAWCARLGLERLKIGPNRPVSDLPPSSRHALAKALSELRETRAGLWLSRHRPGGWSLSEALLRETEQHLNQDHCVIV